MRHSQGGQLSHPDPLLSHMLFFYISQRHFQSQDRPYMRSDGCMQISSALQALASRSHLYSSLHSTK